MKTGSVPMNKDSVWASSGRGFDEANVGGSFPDGRADRGPLDPRFMPTGPSQAGDASLAAGVVKWFNEQKGYGFVELLDGRGDAFVHINVLQAIGRDTLPPGAKVRVVVGAGPKGPQVASVVDVDASGIPARPLRGSPARPARGPRRPDPSTAVPLNGRVKWFDEARGFGFVASEDGGKDIFVHISTLSAAGVRQLAEGQPVNMHVVETPKGREAIAIAV